ncbi:MAG: prenyltransferase/squalene oxidase repeat-containing protein [Pseudomonadota bacterium]
MDGLFKPAETASMAAQLRPAVDRILQIQDAKGAIAWFENGPWDPWNHVESAMALCASGEQLAAAKAYDYLVACQRPDGAWFGEYGNALPMVDRLFISRQEAPAFLDANFCAYPAVGVLHYLEQTGDIERVRSWWPMIARALDFVLTLQRADGTICWSLEALDTEVEDALLAGNASILKSLAAGICLAQALRQTSDHLQDAHHALRAALQKSPHLFDQRGQGQRFAMDWYYPVLSGALDKAAGHARIFEQWDTFVPDERGCRCVMDEPWVTAAETAELVLALIAIDETDLAENLFNSLSDIRDDAGVFWMGWQTQEKIFWPRERPGWTQAAVILAADALENSSSASRLLTRPLV